VQKRKIFAGLWMEKWNFFNHKMIEKFYIETTNLQIGFVETFGGVNIILRVPTTKVGMIKRRTI
jgi:hypothetical protein